MAADTAKDNGETVCLQCYKNDPRTNTGSRHSKDELAVIWDTWIKNLPETYNPSENVAVDDRLYPFKVLGSPLFKVKLCMEYANLNWQAVKWNSREEPRHAKLRKKNLTLVGTVKKNKLDCELDQELLHLQGRELNSSRFVFSEDCTIVSYVPKKNKNVLVLSTMHNDDRVSDGKSSKPDIILHYNNTKGGEDNLDKMASTYSRQRMTTRWLLVMFYIIDVSAYNAYVLWTEKHLTWNAGLLHKRQLLLEKLGKALVQPERMRRKTLPRTAAASRQLKGCEKMLSSHLQAPPLIRIEVADITAPNGKVSLVYVSALLIIHSLVSKRTALRNVVDYANYLQILYSCAEYKNTLNQVTSIVKNCEKQNKILEEKLIKQYNEIRSLYLKLKCNKILSQLHASVEAAIERIKLITSFADETSLKMLNVNAMSLENIALSLKPLFESEDKISALEKSADCNLHCLTSTVNEDTELSTLKETVVVAEEYITEQKFNSIIQYLKRSFPS
ncbi:hypothetical protein T4C_9919 [Trichinella pseudospiralis]|uniref:PiggyBac transposable element-derived protein domain-containing protein n=1 Tax=Trichinella pseudospiralis TaxID=6337 RepID=A0A0V1IVP5_TRIPS|nr:hypothetical protein T4C_9919 [Trichinella pseudospiralis]